MTNIYILIRNLNFIINLYDIAIVLVQEQCIWVYFSLFRTYNQLKNTWHPQAILSTHKRMHLSFVMLEFSKKGENFL